MSSSRTETSAALVDVTMPQMGVSVAEGTVVAWRVGVGDPIAADETICEISTDKIDTEVPAPVGGVVTEILVPIESTVEVGTVLARIAVGGGSDPASAAPAGGSDPAAAPRAGGNGPASAAPAGEDAGSPCAQSTPAPPPIHDAPNSAAPAPPPIHDASNSGAPAPPPIRDAPNSGAIARPPVHDASNSGARTPLPSRDAPHSGVSSNGARNGARGRRYSPVVQRIAAEHDVDLGQVTGTGRDGRVRKQDVLAFIEAHPVEEAPLHIESPYRPEPSPAPKAGAAASPTLSRMRRQIGEHMKRSLDTAATCTTWIEADMSRVERARATLGVTGLAFVARATIDALRQHPALNAWLEGERYTAHEEINLGIAVSLGDDGLIVPVIHRAHELSPEGLAARIKDLARRARSKELTPDDVRGATFTITNPGQYGSIMATPIINQPQVAILDFEAVVKRPVVVTDGDGGDSIAIRPITIFGLSWDHRALDGALAAQFLATVKRHVEGLVVAG